MASLRELVAPALRRILCCVALFFSAWPLSQAMELETPNPAFRAVPEYEMDRGLELFVHANLQFTLLHEMSHMFFDLFDVPLLGSEEDAADRAAIAAILNGGTPEDGFSAEQKLLAVAANWHAEWDSLPENQRSLSYSDGHAQEIQRAHTIACFVYGSDPERYDGLIYAHVMPFKRMIECEAEYQQAVKSVGWLERHYSRSAHGDPELISTRIHVIYDEMKVSRRSAIQYMFNKYQYENFVERIETTYLLPRNVKVVFGMCRGRANASWDTINKQVTVCYELIEHFFETYEIAKSYRSKGCQYSDIRKAMEPFYDCVRQRKEPVSPKI